MSVFSILIWVTLLIRRISAAAAEANVAPTVYVQNTAECVEGSMADITSVRIDDEDYDQHHLSKIAVNITVTHGQLYLPFRTGLYFVYGNIVGPDSRFEVIGKLSDVRKSFSHIKYLAGPDFYGEDLLQLTVFDMHMQSRSGDPGGHDLALLPDHPPLTASTVISVLPDNDAPTITASARFLTCDQQQVEADGSPAISSSSFSAVLSDSDLITPELYQNSQFQLSLTTRFGTLRLPGSRCDATAYTCTVVDTLPNLNKLTAKITYTPDAGYNKFKGSERIGKDSVCHQCFDQRS